MGSSTPGGVSILMTLAPQSASWRTQVGPERTRVRSSTVKRASAFDARGKAIFLGASNAISSGNETLPTLPPLSTGLPPRRMLVPAVVLGYYGAWPSFRHFQEAIMN